MKRVLLTGASGFIGRHLLSTLISRFDEVHTLTHRSSPPTFPGATTHSGDLLARGEPERLCSLIRPTHLIHLAWYAEPKKYWTSPLNLDWLEASFALLRAFADNGGERVVVAGTAAEYCWKNGECDEAKTPTTPATLYGETKLRLTELGEALSRTVSPQFIFSSARLFSVFGPHEPRDRLIPTVLRSLLEGREAPCPSGRQSRDFLFVQDMAEAVGAIALSSISGPINVGSGRATTLHELLTTCGKVTGRGDLLRFGALPDTQAEFPSVFANTRRINDEVGWKPRFSLEEGIQETARWWKERGEIG